MKRALLFLGGAWLVQALATAGCAEGGDTMIGVPSTDASTDVSAEGSADSGGGSAGAADGGGGAAGTAGDASVGGGAGEGGSAGQAGGAGDGGSAGQAGQAGQAGSSGAGGAGGAGGTGGTGGAGGTGGKGGAGGSGGTGGTGGAGGAGGGTGGTGGGTGGTGGAPPAWAHTIFIDGTKDFNANEAFPTTSSNYTAYITWDTTNIYVGMEGADVGSASATKWVLIYLSGSPGSTNGQPYGTQQPTLPFAARWHLRWKANNSFASMEQYSGSWVEAGWDLSGDIFQNGNYVELRIPRSDLGYPTSVSMHVCMLNEESTGLWTYAGVPSTSFADGIDPNFTKYFEFDLSSAAAPTTYTPKP